MKRRWSLTWVSAIAISVMVVSGCGLSTGQDPLDGNANSDGGDSGVHPERVVGFGQTFTWNDGLSVTLSKPREFKPSPYAHVRSAHGRMGKTFLVVTVEVVNHTGHAFDPRWFVASLPPGSPAGTVSDKDKAIGAQPRTKLMDGREATWRLGYAVVNPDHLILEVSPGLERQPVTYTSK